jgi:hypothetical protein
MIYRFKKPGDGANVAVSLEKAHIYFTIQWGEIQR